MPRWQLLTESARMDGKLTGSFSDDDRRWRLSILAKTLVRAKAEVERAQRELDADVAAARRDGQGRIADEMLQELAERLARH